ncbi:hypothetical protein IAT38_002954 [Cryptococcus sp. DSM 104549]
MVKSDTPQAGPSRPTPSSRRSSIEDDEGANPRTVSAPTAAAGVGGPHVQGEEGDEDEERVDIKLIQSFADKIQHLPSTDTIDGATGRAQIIIPKRGEKDFEPLAETVNLQDMLLQNSRQALFNALVGVRGGHNNAISHALYTHSHPFPRMIISHGHLIDTMGITVRTPAPDGSKGKGKTSMELLPEEALYLQERGTLQIWIGKDAETEEEIEAGVGEWCAEEYGVKGAIEMSVMEAFGAFIGREGLTLERYQAYAYLKRLGYNVQRSRQFIPEHFLTQPTVIRLDEQDPQLPPFTTWWLRLPRWIAGLFKRLGRAFQDAARSVSSVGLRIRIRGTSALRGSLLEGWCGRTYPSIFKHLRIVPSGHSQPLPLRPRPPPATSIYDHLIANPYIPFFHIWKPMTPWSKRVWDKGSEEGMRTQRPDYFAGVIQARTTPMPSINQLSEVFDMLPDEPKGPIKRQGPQYQRPPRAQPAKPQAATKPATAFDALRARFGCANSTAAPRPAQSGVNIGALRNGDRGFIVAVNDSGNSGWVRFGRTGFAEAAPM